MNSMESGAQTSEVGQESQQLSTEQLRKLADRVFHLLKEEARIEYERFRPTSNHRRYRQGGR